LREGRDAPLIRDVQLMVRHLLALRVEASGSSNAFALRPAREDHAVSVRLELPGGFEAQAAVRAGDQGGGPIRFFVDHATPPNESVRLVILLRWPPSDVLSGDNGPKALMRRRFDLNLPRARIRGCFRWPPRRCAFVYRFRRPCSRRSSCFSSAWPPPGPRALTDESKDPSRRTVRRSRSLAPPSTQHSPILTTSSTPP